MLQLTEDPHKGFTVIGVVGPNHGVITTGSTRVDHPITTHWDEDL